MFASILLISSFTAAITSGLTLRRLESAVRSPDDLYSLRVASVAPSVSADYLDRRHIDYQNYPTAIAALRALAKGDADAVVYDSPILRYLVATQIGGRVRHGAFGVGTIKHLEGAGERRKVTVDFRSVGVKKLLLKYASLEPA